MSHKNIGYHTRLVGQNTVKVTGGSFGGQIDAETVERLTRLFTVTVKPSGRAVFVDRVGQEVSLYLSVDPDATEIGKEALRAWRAEKEHAEAVRRKKNEALEGELESLLSEMGAERAIEILKKNNDG